MAGVSAASTSGELESGHDKPVLSATVNADGFASVDGAGLSHLDLLVHGIHCPNCIRDIEQGLRGCRDVVEARLNYTTARLHVAWRGSLTAGEIIGKVADLGFRAVPLDPATILSKDSEEQALLKALAVAGFAAANVMLLSISVWSGADMGPATRDLLHWLSALIALPAVAYAGRPFFSSALSALHAGRLNMDVPISLAVLLACVMSVAQTLKSGTHAYFDAAVMLLFFLLIGRFLDRRMRVHARSAARDLVALQAATATIVGSDGTLDVRPVTSVMPGDCMQVAKGERVPVDGAVEQGYSDMDFSMLTGESLPQAVGVGARVFAGTVNLGAPILVRAEKHSTDSLLSEIVRLMAAAEQGRTRYVRLADRAARIYVPVVHVLALATFLGWWVLGGAWEAAAQNAIAVLIITCPCALGLAVPAVQVVASGLLFRHGILVKSGDGLERLAEATHVVFDKTGTLTEGTLKHLNSDDVSVDNLALAASLARASRHPLSRAVAEAAGPGPVLDDVHEEPGHGLRADLAGGEARLGSRAWAGAEGAAAHDDIPELWLKRPDGTLVRFTFSDRLRTDAGQVVKTLEQEGMSVELLSGDRPATVASCAAEAGIGAQVGGLLPADKIRQIHAREHDGKRVLMVGDGLNDAPALAAAHASMSPASAVDVSQTTADFVFQGKGLSAVPLAIRMARAARRLVLQNFTLAAAYNAVAIPLAMAGLVTPLIAALAMSASSILVTANALRLRLLVRA